MISLKAKSLTSRLSKRAFWLLALLITVPISVSAVLAINNLKDELANQEKAHLHRFEKSFLLSAYGELQKQEIQLKELLSWGSDLSTDALVSVLNKSFDRYVVSGPALYVASGVTRAQLDAFLELESNKQTERASVFVVNDDGKGQIWMAKNLPGGTFAAVSISPFKQVGAQELLPKYIELCVIEESGVRIFCPHDFTDVAIAKAVEASRNLYTGEAVWVADDSSYIGNYWTLFLRSGFASANWIIITRVPKDYVFSPITAFSQSFIPLIIIVIISSILILLVQLRRNLAPLERLLEGTKRIVKKDFSTRIHLEGEDEFAELAKSFNLMSSHLDRQFLSIAVSAQIDETILSTFDINRVINLLLVRIFEILDCTTSSVVFVDQEENTNRVYYCTGDKEPEFVDVIGELDLDGVRQLKWFGTKDKSAAIKSVFKCVGQRFYGASVPISIDGKTVGLFVVGMQKEEQDLEVTEDVLSELAQRLAVAKSADEWEARLQYQALHDSLTGLPNRLSFQTYLQNAVNTDGSLTVLFIDLDHFKNVNDTKGHSTGDRLLQLAAQRLKETVISQGEVFRLGGDEFTIVINYTDETKVKRLIERVLQHMRAPFLIDSADYVVTASIGASRFPEDGRDVESLLKNADLAMYFAKQDGRNKVKFFDSKMMALTYCRTVLETDLRKAMQEKQFFLMYQPQIHIRNQEVVCLEALIRWQHPEHGVISPSTFIPVAESIGMIEELDKWVLNTIFDQFYRWAERNVVVNKIAVNVSSTSLRTRGYLEHLKTLISQHDGKGFLELELTENVFLDDTDQVYAIMKQIKQLGVNIALDDFGTGYSSMSYLHKFPIDSLKIDASFIREICKEKDTRSIVQAIIKVAKSLGLRVVAEGVESEEQLAFLDFEGCDIVQGFYYSKPIQVDTVSNYIESFKVEMLRQLSG